MRTELLVVVCAAALAAQPAGFEVASVKRAPERSGAGRLMQLNKSPGRIAYSNVTLKILIAIAYDMSDAKISYTAKQDWIDSTPYDVHAAFPADTSGDEFLVMLRQLLAERFGLVVHKDVRSMAAYELVVARKGAQLKPAADEKGSSYILPGHIVGRYVTMGWLADMLARQTGRPAVDATKIDGHFDFDLKWAPDGANQDAGRSIYTALEEQLGLKLNPDRAPVEYLVVDRANRDPAE